ncbi:MAG TPA: putative baseplate assembly protein [Pyrinomonadaceae bacterium]|nr:putative baseplate assembly protein [Pyrinomonadaceae bacterium]
MKQCGCSKNLSCGCCEGVEALTPQPTANRPGLSALRYRIGTHSTFFETMQARLSGFYLRSSGDGDDKHYPLAGLKTRLTNDASIALLSAAATVFDVLTFYQERIANEGYLRTATERRSVLELGRLVGYTPRPGVAASVYLAYTLDDNSEPVEIPLGARAQSVPLPVKSSAEATAQSAPLPAELPQSFETSEKLEARKEWNDLKPRATRPQNITIKNAGFIKTIYFEGTETNLKPNDPLLFVFEGQGAAPIFRRVETVEPLFDDRKTKITLLLSFDNTILEFIERYLTNFEAFCIDAQDKLIIRARKLLSDVRKAITDAQPEEDQMLKDAEQLIINIDESGNTHVQKWFDSLVKELIYTLRSLGVIDEWLNNLGEQGGFDDFNDGLREFAGTMGNLAGLIKILRKSDGFGELVGEVIEVLSKFAKFDVLIFQNLINDLIRLLRSQGILDQWLSDLPAGNFKKLLDELQSVAAEGNISDKLIRALLGLDSFDESVDKVAETAGGYNDFSEEKLKEFITRIRQPSSVSALSSFVSLTRPLSLPASKQPANSLVLGRSAKQVFDVRNDTLPQMVAAFNKDVGEKAYQAWANTTVTKPQRVKVYALRVTAQLFGSTAAPRFKVEKDGTMTNLGEPLIVEVFEANKLPPPGFDGEIDAETRRAVIKHEEENFIYLNSSYDKIVPDSWIVVDTRDVERLNSNRDLTPNFELLPNNLLITKAKDVSASISRTNYGMSGKTTHINLGDSRWITYVEDKNLKNSLDSEFRLVRKTVVYAQSEQLELADEPLNDDVCGSRIELGYLYEGLRAGRWIIVSGERTDILNTSGVMASELVMLAGIEQSYDPEMPGDKIHSTLILANRLAYTYKRKTVKIYGNVVKATHGETRSEVLGSGDATQTMQTFTLKQPPLTFVSAPTPNGIESTLEVRVNDVRWHETDSLAGLKPQDRKFITKTSDEAQTSVIFGNGEQGARLPTGVENVRAVYRSGIGKSGNVKAEQISLLMTKPLGVREVINPLRASGGADKETRDQARRNAPIALMALDRLVSTRDYADFARTFAGIGKSSAARLSDGYRQIVHLTIAGAADIPIDVNSDLYKNLRRSLLKYGNPFQPVQIVTRELLALIIVAKVGIHADYLWESVAPKIRAALLDAFSFERRELGQSVFLSEVVSVIQSVEGVLYSDIDVLDGISETELSSEAALKTKTDSWLVPDSPHSYVQAKLARKNLEFQPGANPAQARILPAQLAYLTPDVPDTLILNQIEEAKK